MAIVDLNIKLKFCSTRRIYQARVDKLAVLQQEVEAQQSDVNDINSELVARATSLKDENPKGKHCASLPSEHSGGQRLFL